MGHQNPSERIPIPNTNNPKTCQDPKPFQVSTHSRDILCEKIQQYNRLREFWEMTESICCFYMHIYTCTFLCTYFGMPGYAQ